MMQGITRLFQPHDADLNYVSPEAHGRFSPGSTVVRTGEADELTVVSATPGSAGTPATVTVEGGTTYWDRELQYPDGAFQPGTLVGVLPEAGIAPCFCYPALGVVGPEGDDALITVHYDHRVDVERPLTGCPDRTRLRRHILKVHRRWVRIATVEDVVQAMLRMGPAWTAHLCEIPWNDAQHAFISPYLSLVEAGGHTPGWDGLGVPADMLRTAGTCGRARPRTAEAPPIVVQVWPDDGPSWRYNKAVCYALDGLGRSIVRRVCGLIMRDPGYRPLRETRQELTRLVTAWMQRRSHG